MVSVEESPLKRPQKKRGTLQTKRPTLVRNLPPPTPPPPLPSPPPPTTNRPRPTGLEEALAAAPQRRQVLRRQKVLEDPHGRVEAEGRRQRASRERTVSLDDGGAAFCKWQGAPLHSFQSVYLGECMIYIFITARGQK